MRNHHDRLGGAFQGRQGGLHPLLAGRLGIVERQLGSDDGVPALAQERGQRLPARGVVPFPVEEAERGDMSTVKKFRARVDFAARSFDVWVERGNPANTKEAAMRFMVMVKATTDSEAGVMPSEELLAAMGKFNEELVKAGVMLAGEGLHPSSKGARVRFSGDKRDRDRRPVRRDEGAGRRLLAAPG